MVVDVEIRRFLSVVEIRFVWGFPPCFGHVSIVRYRKLVVFPVHFFVLFVEGMVKGASARLASYSTSHWHFEAIFKLNCDRPGDGRVSPK